MKTKHKLQAVEDSGDNNNNLAESDKDDNVDVLTELEASAYDVEAMVSTTVIDFEPGDVLGKLLAFINQVHMSSEGVHEYLDHLCAVNQLKLCLWVWT